MACLTAVTTVLPSRDGTEELSELVRLRRTWCKPRYCVLAVNRESLGAGKTLVRMGLGCPHLYHRNCY